MLILMATSLIASALSEREIAYFAGTFVYMLVGCTAAVYWDVIGPLILSINVKTWWYSVVATIICTVLVTWPTSLLPMLNAVVFPIAICFCVLSTPVRSPIVARIFLNHGIIYLGRASFTLYLWQQLATTRALFLHPLITFAALAGAVVVAVLSFELLETPLARIGRKYTDLVNGSSLTRGTGQNSI